MLGGLMGNVNGTTPIVRILFYWCRFVEVLAGIFMEGDPHILKLCLELIEKLSDVCKGWVQKN